MSFLWDVDEEGDLDTVSARNFFGSPPVVCFAKEYKRRT